MKDFIRIFPSCSSPFPMVLAERTATRPCFLESGVQAGTADSAAGVEVVLFSGIWKVTVKSFSEETVKPLLLPNLVRFWTAISLSTRMIRVPPFVISSDSFFAFTTGSGQAIPLASNVFVSMCNSSYYLYCIF